MEPDEEKTVQEKLPSALRRTRALLRAMAEHRLGADDLEEALETSLSPEERDEILTQLRWSQQRYQSPGERLAHMLEAVKRWQR